MPDAAAPEGVIFEDPPLTRSVWKKALRNRPGEWAIIPVAYDSAGVLRIQNPDFEILARTVDGEQRVYARYMGEAAS